MGPYEFGIKVSVVTTKALSGIPHDGHALATVIPHTEVLVGKPSRVSPPTRHTAITFHLRPEARGDAHYQW